MLKQALTDSWYFFKNHALAFSQIILPVVIPLNIITELYQHVFTSQDFLIKELIPVTLGIIAYPIYMVGVIFYIASSVSGKNLDTKTLWKLGIKFWSPYIGLWILVAVAVMFGFILLVIPGVILAARYSFSEFDLLLNQSKPLDAMRNSWLVSKDYMWIILGGIGVITIVLYAPFFLVASLFDKSTFLYWALDIFADTAYSVLGVLYTIFLFRVYVLAISKHDQPPKQNAP